MAYSDPEMSRYGQVKVNINGYQQKAFEATADHFKKRVSELAHMWLMEPEHPVTIRSRAHFYQLLDDHKAGLTQDFWRRFTDSQTAA